MSAEKYQSGLFHDRCRLLFFLFNRWMKFAWWRLGNVPLASSFETSFLDLDRLSILADVDCHFFRSISVNNSPDWYYRPTSVLKKNCAMSAEKYQSGLFRDRCQVLFFLFNRWMKFAWWRLGNVRSASSGKTSFLDLDRSSFLADVDCHFFRPISVNNIFLPRWANVCLAE